MQKVAVIGVGVHPYGKWDDKSILDMANPAIQGALKTAGIKWEQVQSGWCGHTTQGIICGERTFPIFGMTGLSITNVENASATGSYAFRGAFLEIALGEFDIAIALGVDKRNIEHQIPFAKEIENETKDKGSENKGKKVKKVNLAIAKFAQDAREHMQKYGTTIDQLAKVAVKNRYNASLNPNAQFQERVTLEDVHNARMVADPLTVMHCCPFSDGAAAAILASETAVKQLKISNPIWIDASVSKTQCAPSFDKRDVTAITAEEAYKKAGIGPSDLGLVELHNAFTIEELTLSEHLGLCPEGQGGALIDEGATDIDGRIPINTSGGLLAMGHPMGPTGVGQVAEIFWQMRGEAGKRQIPTPPKTAMAHMIGLGGSCIIHLFSR